MLPNLVGRAADASLGWLWPSWRSKTSRGQIQWITYVLPVWYLVNRWGLGPKVCMHHFGCGMNWIKGYYMIVKVQNETFWFSTYSMEMHSVTSSSFIICLWGETFGSRTILSSSLMAFLTFTFSLFLSLPSFKSRVKWFRLMQMFSIFISFLFFSGGLRAKQSPTIFVGGPNEHHYSMYFYAGAAPG